MRVANVVEGHRLRLSDPGTASFAQFVRCLRLIIPDVQFVWLYLSEFSSRNRIFIYFSHCAPRVQSKWWDGSIKVILVQATWGCYIARAHDSCISDIILQKTACLMITCWLRMYIDTFFVLVYNKGISYNVVISTGVTTIISPTIDISYFTWMREFHSVHRLSACCSP